MEYKQNLIEVGFTNDKVPAFLEVRGKNWVKYGETNDYPQYLVALFNRSAKHNAIVTYKQLYVKGQGWVFNPEGMDGAEQISLRAFIDNPNPYETLEDLLAKTALDVELFNGFYFKVVQSKKQGAKQYIYHVDYCKVRSNEDNTEFYLSDEWIGENGEENNNPDIKETLPAYNADKPAKESLFYYKAYRPNLDVYTLPDYIGAVPAIITDAEIANFHRAEIQNGFKGSKMIVFKNGVPNDDEIKSVERRMKAKFSPTDKAGVFLIDFVDDVTRVPEVLDLGAGDFADKYNALNDTIQQEIFVGHKVTSPMLFGVRVEGQLGGRNEMVDAFNLFQNTYVTPRQRVQENVYNIFSPVKGKLKIKTIEPIMPSFSEQTLQMILTKDEMREIIGREPIAEPAAAQPKTFAKCEHFNSQADDSIDFEVFQKYGEPIEAFSTVKKKKFMFSKQDFALSKIEQGVLDLIKKTPSIKADDIQKVMRLDKTAVINILETLTADGLIEVSNGGQTVTPKGAEIKVPSFETLFIRYRYSLRPDAPALLGESRDFCQSMMDNPRYFSREDIEMIGEELGQIYGIPNYDAFTRRGGWYHNPDTNTNLPFCRHIWQQELVKRK